jgi:hypothetical protein
LLAKWDFSGDLGKSEDFLNRMIAQGWRPIREEFGGRFVFVPCSPGECVCRTVMTVTSGGFYDKRKAAELTELLMAGGAYIVEQRNSLGTQCGLIAVRSAAWGPFEINSDLDSRIAEYRARMRYYEGPGALWLSVAVVFGITLMTTAMGADVVSVTMNSLVVACSLLTSALNFIPAIRCRRAVKCLEAQRNISEV